MQPAKRRRGLMTAAKQAQPVRVQNPRFFGTPTPPAAPAPPQAAPVAPVTPPVTPPVAPPATPVTPPPVGPATPQNLGPAVGSTSAAEIAAGLMDKDSPLMQKADAQGKQFAASRGLLNSSMAGQASQSAMLDQIVPLASQEADVNARSQTDDRNRVFTANQAGLDRTAATGLAALNNAADMEQQKFVTQAATSTADRDRASREALAKIEVKDSDRRAATAMLTNAQDVYAEARASILNNPDLPAAERNKLLDRATKDLEVSTNYIQGLFGAAFEWPKNPWTTTAKAKPTKPAPAATV